MNRPDRLNRMVLAGLGLVLLAAGVYGLVRSYGGFGDGQAREPFLLDDVRTFVERNHDWFWSVAFVVTLIVAYLGYRWLRAQLVPNRHTPPLVVTDGPDELVMDSSALDDAVADDLERDHRITHAGARFTNLDDEAELALSLTVVEDASLAQIREHIEGPILDRARAAFETEPIHTHVVIGFSQRGERNLT